MKIGLDQLGVPAPLFYRRACNAYIMMIAPAMTGFIATLPIEPTIKHIITGGMVVSMSFAKAFEYLLGDTTITTNEPAK